MQTDEGKLEVGDVVMLVSREGPRMTVEGLTDDPENTKANVCWFTEDNHLMRAPIAVKVLQKVQNA